ncbi:DUF1289 domain-containing protein [Ferrimonas balearica]|uniref:DUF1289 domain-containing protein n=1 Tax=Ferrimonas balearica TaxID=44012 RepID=UPI001C99DE82|nr:DUF1289 domain-containing protein [Ferrimonas balearica]MBY5992175.1 DUF1289 domain-containing protein [Ferrimonas balearica]
MSVSSPCVGCCKLDEQEICMGCYRSLEEIANWNRRSDDERQGILDRIAHRAETYRDRDYHAIPTHPITRKAVLAVKE